MCRPTNDETAESVYRDAVDALWLVYEPKFRALLDRYSAAFTDEGWLVQGVDDLTDEEYSLALAVKSPSGTDCGVRVTLVESQCRDDELSGIAFSVDLDSACGHVIGGMTPYNYSPELWIPVDNLDAIAGRWQLFEQADKYSAVEVIGRHLIEDAVKVTRWSSVWGGYFGSAQSMKTRASRSFSRRGSRCTNRRPRRK